MILLLQHKKVHPLADLDALRITVEGPLEVCIIEDTITIDIDPDNIEVDIICT